MKTANGTANGVHKRLSKANTSTTAKVITQPGAEPTKPSGDGAPERDAIGRFRVGNRGGTGNPFARRVAALRSALLAELTEEKVSKVAAKLFDLAIGGDVAAAKLLLLYSVGKPTEAVDPDRLDIHEFHLLDQHPTRSEFLRAFFESIPADQAVRALIEWWQLKLAEDPRLFLPLGKKDMSKELLGRVADEVERRIQKK